MAEIRWTNAGGIGERSYTCGYCGRLVGPDLGYLGDGEHLILICPFCSRPTYLEGSEQVPGVAFGEDVEALPREIEALYKEARQCMAVSAYTAAVLTCRKLLMNIAVSKGADEGQPFIKYVEYLASKNYVPPDGHGWVDHIRTTGNEAAHEIHLMSKSDAEDLISFVGMLLKIVFEFPSRIRGPTTDEGTST